MKNTAWYVISVAIKMLLTEKVSTDEIKEKFNKIVDFLELGGVE